MKGFFRKLFNIYPGEEKSAILFGLLGFLWAFGVTAGLKFADALFLLHVGASSLPTVYKLTACGMLLLASGLLYAFNVISIHRIFTLVLCVGIGFYFFVNLYLTYDTGFQSTWIWYALRIFGSLFFTLVVTCFWTFVDHYYHLQDAKRLYSLFTSMIFIGVAFTGILMRSGWISFQHLTIGIMAILGATIFLIFYIVKRLKPVHDENENLGTPTQGDGSWRAQVKSVLTSRFTLLLMTANFLIYVLLVLTEYNYMSSFDAAFAPEVIKATGDEQNATLTQFLGQWIAIVSVSNLFFGLFLYSRLVRRFGIGSLVICTPLLLLVTFSGWTMSSALLFPILGLFVVEGTLYVIDDSNFNLLLNAVPTKLKYKIRLIIESFFEPIGMLISSLLLSVTWIDSKVLGLILAGCLLLVALALKFQYLKGIYRNLSENAIHFQRSIQGWFSRLSDKEGRAAEKRLLAIVRQGDERFISTAVDGLLSFDNASLALKMLWQIEADDLESKLICVHALSKHPIGKDSSIIDYVHQWLYEGPSSRLQSALHFYLAMQGCLRPEQVADDLATPDLERRGAAILAYNKTWAGQNAETAIYNRRLALEGLQNLLAGNESEVAMGLTLLGIAPIAPEIDIVIPFLTSPSSKIARIASHTSAQIATPQSSQYVPTLISLLAASSDSDFRLNCLTAIGKIKDTTLVRELITAAIHFRPSEMRATEKVIASMGVGSVPILLASIKDSKLHDRCRVLASRVLGQLNLPLLRDHVYEILHIEIERAYFYFYYYDTIQAANPNLDLLILQDALLNGYHSVLDFVIQLLGVAGELEDCELLSRSLRSPHPKVRSQVVETLERTCETKIFRLLNPLVSDLPKEERLRTYRKRHLVDLSLDELLDRLACSPAYVDQIIAAALKYRFNMPNWRTSLKKQMSSNEEIFQHFARELLST